MLNCKNHILVNYTDLKKGTKLFRSSQVKARVTKNRGMIEKTIYSILNYLLSD